VINYLSLHKNNQNTRAIRRL